MSGESTTTLAEARALAYKAAEHKQGTSCPLCTGHMQVYKRRLNARMARTVIYLELWDRARPGSWHHVQNRFGSEKILGGGPPGDHGKLPWWGLIEKANDDVNHDGPGNGLYRITAAGRLFALGKTTALAWCIEYKSTVLEWSSESVTIEEALGTEFNYRELMNLPARDMLQAALL